MMKRRCPSSRALWVSMAGLTWKRLEVRITHGLHPASFTSQWRCQWHTRLEVVSYHSISFLHFYQNDFWGRNRNHSSTTKKIDKGECSIHNLWLYSMFSHALAIPVAVRIAPRGLLSKSQGNRKRKNTLLARGFDPLKNHLSHWAIEDHHPKVWINKRTWNHQQDEKWWK